MKKFALLLALIVGCIGCGGQSTPVPLDGAYPIYNTAWTGTFSETDASLTGTLTLAVSASGVVSGTWQDYNNFVYTMAGTAGRQGALKGTFINSSGGQNGTFTGAVTTAGSGTDISSATASGTMTLIFPGSFVPFTVSLTYSGIPKSHAKP